MSAGSVAGTIVAFCKKCGAQLRAPASLAGKRGKCARCGTAILIPLRSEQPPAAARPSHDAKADQKPQRKPLNMPLVCLGAVGVGLVLGLAIYAVLPSSQAFLSPLPEVPRADIAPSAAPPAQPAAQAAPADVRSKQPPLPNVVILTPKGAKSPERPSWRPNPSQSGPPQPGPGSKPTFGPGPGMKHGPGSGWEAGKGPGGSWMGMRRRLAPGEDPGGPDPVTEGVPSSGKRRGPDPGPDGGVTHGPEPDSAPGMGPGMDPGMGPGRGPGDQGPRPKRGPESGRNPG
jgi:hypothetical protein